MLLLPDDNIFSAAAEKAFATLRRVGFVGGLSRDIAGEVAELAYSNDNDTPHYCRQMPDDDARHCVQAQWDDMAD
mgnify:CR=1 FL=1